jgi:hypothetical protein
LGDSFARDDGGGNWFAPDDGGRWSGGRELGGDGRFTVASGDASGTGGRPGGFGNLFPRAFTTSSERFPASQSSAAVRAKTSVRSSSPLSLASSAAFCTQRSASS